MINHTVKQLPHILNQPAIETEVEDKNLYLSHQQCTNTSQQWPYHARCLAG